MLLKIVATGRSQAHRIPPKLTDVVLVGVPCVLSEDDVWSAPISGVERGQYYRLHVLSLTGPVRDDRSIV